MKPIPPQNCRHESVTSWPKRLQFAHGCELCYIVSCCIKIYKGKNDKGEYIHFFIISFFFFLRKNMHIWNFHPVVISCSQLHHPMLYQKNFTNLYLHTSQYTIYLQTYQISNHQSLQRVTHRAQLSKWDSPHSKGDLHHLAKSSSLFLFLDTTMFNLPLHIRPYNIPWMSDWKSLPS